jgi:phosphoribosylglycinamide formyltransferase-1
VISNKPGVKALARASAAGVPALSVPHQDFDSREAFDARLSQCLKSAQVEWVILAGFMRLLTPVFLNAFKDRVVNLHPSLLPAFPGVNAVAQALEYGVKVTGCTVHLVTEGMDSGPVIAQRVVPILDDDNEQGLLERMHAAEHQLLVEVVQGICEHRLAIVRGEGRPKASLRANG